MQHKILLYGEYWDGTHVECISRVLNQKNICFKIFDFFKIISPFENPNIFQKAIRKINYKKNENIINLLLCKEIDLFKPTILLISKGVNIYPETLLSFSKKGILITNWNPDDFFNPNNSSIHLLNSLELFDIVFSARKHLFPEYINKGIKNPKYLEWYYIPWLHKSPLINEKPKDVITFIGTYSKRRESIISNIDNQFKIEIWGSGWNTTNLRFKKNIIIHNQILNQNQFPNYISRSKINLNILTKENRDLTNLKLFEITASGGLLLTENNSTTKELLQNNCLYYDHDNIDEFNNTLQMIFDHKNHNYIQDFRLKGTKYIINNNFSINDRVEELLNYL